jgi:hypothetical protein
VWLDPEFGIILTLPFLYISHECVIHNTRITLSYYNLRDIVTFSEGNFERRSQKPNIPGRVPGTRIGIGSGIPSDQDLINSHTCFHSLDNPAKMRGFIRLNPEFPRFRARNNRDRKTGIHPTGKTYKNHVFQKISLI